MIEKILACIILYSVFAFGVLPAVLAEKHSTYKESVIFSFYFQLAIAIVAGCISAVIWALNTLF